VTESSPVDEQWRAVVGYEGFYEVSDAGRVRSVDRVVIDCNGNRTRLFRGVVLKQATISKGYRAVGLCRRDRPMVTKYVHHLVLEAFVGPKPVGMECCHGVGGPADNRLSNVRWGSSSENNHDIVHHGNHHQANKALCPQGHELREPNLIVRFLQDGHRSCLACHHAHGRARKARQAGRSYDLASLMAECYAELMTGTARVDNKSKTHCLAGHLLAPPNLTACSVRRGQRSCLTCSRARARVRQLGRPDELAALRAKYYAEIMADADNAIAYAVLVS
jgi:hypothetical protein